MPAMIEVRHLLVAIDVFRKATGLEDVTLSHRLFKDSKKLTALRAGSGITVDRFNNAFVWLSENWPDDTDWPADVPRPVLTEQAIRLVAAEAVAVPIMDEKHSEAAE